MMMRVAIRTMSRKKKTILGSPKRMGKKARMRRKNMRSTSVNPR
jgi:hypothetical protein